MGMKNLLNWPEQTFIYPEPFCSNAKQNYHLEMDEYRVYNLVVTSQRQAKELIKESLPKFEISPYQRQTNRQIYGMYANKELQAK